MCPRSLPPPRNAIAYWVAIRSCGKYCRQESRRPVSSTATYTPAPVCATVRSGPAWMFVTLMASRSQVFRPTRKLGSDTVSMGTPVRSASGVAAMTKGSARIVARSPSRARMVRALISASVLSTVPCCASAARLAGDRSLTSTLTPSCRFCAVTKCPISGLNSSAAMRRPIRDAMGGVSGGGGIIAVLEAPLKLCRINGRALT